MVEAVWAGLLLVFQWPAIGYLLLGVALGMWLGAVPGLGGIIGLVLLLPFTFGMEPVPAFALLLGMFSVVSTSDTIASVMLGIPGTAASQATILDGYPLAQKGHAARALGAAFTVSAFGGVFGALVLAVSLPIVLPVILAFASPELFMLGVLGLAMVGSLSGGSIVKGLAVATLGLLMSTVGYAETISVPRYYFGSNYLLDGLPLIPVVLGLFAVPELMELAIRNVSISRVERDESGAGDMIEGIRDAFRHKWLATRCAAIGAYIGILPGLGGAIVDWLAYGHAVQSAKDKSQFGQGDIRGVIAPEAANNATRGGALIPTVAFGIPGGIGAAILLTALLIQGLRPGREMLTIHLDLTFSMVWTIVVANIVAAGALMLWSRQVAKVAFIPGHLVVPGALLFVLMGAWLAGTSLGDWVTVVVMGVVGFVMKRGGWPRPPLVLAMILGPILENSFQISIRAYDGYGWVFRPVALVVAILVVATIVLSARGIIANRRSDAPTVGEGAERNPALSLPFSTLLVALYVYAIAATSDWPQSVRDFPLAAAVPGLALMVLAFGIDVLAFRRRLAEAGTLASLYANAARNALLTKALLFFATIAAVLVLSPLIGQKLAIVLFVAFYLAVWGGYKWPTVAAYTAGAWVILVAFYDQVLHLFWMQSVAGQSVGTQLPDWLPKWLFF